MRRWPSGGSAPQPLRRPARPVRAPAAELIHRVAVAAAHLLVVLVPAIVHRQERCYTS